MMSELQDHGLILQTIAMSDDDEAPVRSSHQRTVVDSPMNDAEDSASEEEVKPKQRSLMQNLLTGGDIGDEDDEDDEDESEGDEEDDDEEEEDDEEEDDAPKKKHKSKSSKSSKKSRKPTKKDRVAQFFDLEAEVDDDDDEDEDDGEGDDMLADAKEELEIAKQEAVSRASARRAFMDEMEGKKEEDIARMYEEKAAAQKVSRVQRASSDAMGESAISQRGLLPTINDPKLWLCRCKPGHEREIIVALMQKFYDKRDSDMPVMIKSAIAIDSLKGYFYIEADTDSHVNAAIRGLRNLFHWQIQLIPLDEMVSVLNVSHARAQLSKDSWVRMKRGVYRGDLAQVVQADEVAQKALVKLIPRLSTGDEKPMNDEEGGKRKRNIAQQKPPARFFNIDDYPSNHVEEKRDKRTGELFHVYNGNQFRDGYLYKAVSYKTLELAGVQPSLEELQKFHNTSAKKDDESEEEDESGFALPKLKRDASTTKTLFAKGDLVTVISGDLKNLEAVVERSDGDTVTVMPKHKEINEYLDFQASELKKAFKQGDHVKVVNGKYNGETGLVLNVDEADVLTLFGDLTMDEIKVFSRDVQKTSEVATGLDSIGVYGLYDLVQLDPTSVGIIVKVERDSFKVLDQLGNVKTIPEKEIGRKKNSKFTASLDSKHNTINQNDNVMVIEGVMKGRVGQIKHLFKSYAFIHSRDYIENAGIFVVRSRMVQLIDARTTSKEDPFSQFALASPMRGGQTPTHVPGSPAGRAPPSSGGRGRGRGQVDPIMHKTVKIISGPYKGYFGMVKDAGDRTARVELQGVLRVVEIERQKLVITNSDGSTNFAIEMTPGRTVATPMWSDARTPLRTPMRGDSLGTPMHESMRTPSRDISTPLHDAWNPNAPQTPGRSDMDLSDISASLGYSSTNWSGPSGKWGDVGTPNVGTPAPPNTVGPTYTPYDVQTPGGSYTADSPLAGGYGQTPFTPGYSGHTPSTPGFSRTPHEEAMSPAPSQPVRAEWHIPGVEVTYRSNVGTISSVDGSNITLLLANTGRSLTVPVQEVTRVPPSKKDRVKVVRGEFAGQVGTLIGLDAADGIVKLEETSDIKIMDMDFLAKLGQ